jgi:hypothetical protein
MKFNQNISGDLCGSAHQAENSNEISNTDLKYLKYKLRSFFLGLFWNFWRLRRILDGIPLI